MGVHSDRIGRQAIGACNFSAKRLESGGGLLVSNRYGSFSSKPVIQSFIDAGQAWCSGKTRLAQGRSQTCDVVSFETGPLVGGQRTV
jgi:hypothetical protein